MRIEPKLGSKYVKVAVPENYFLKLSKIMFYGMEFKVPTKTEEYLAFRYGSDWRIEKKDYIFYEEDGAIAEKSNIIIKN